MQWIPMIATSAFRSLSCVHTGKSAKLWSGEVIRFQCSEIRFYTVKISVKSSKKGNLDLFQSLDAEFNCV
jgi:hypothetical protein